VRGYLSKPLAARSCFLISARPSRRERKNHLKSFLALPRVADVYDRSLYIEELDGLAHLRGSRPRWEQLDAEVSPRTPFTSPAWAKLCGKHMRQSPIDDPAMNSSIHVVRDPGPGKALGSVVPLLITAPDLLTVRCSCALLQFFGAADGKHNRASSHHFAGKMTNGTLSRRSPKYLLDRKDKMGSIRLDRHPVRRNRTLQGSEAC